MSNDLISRKALMEGRVENDPVRIAAMCAETAYEVENDWIPCSERMPDKGEKVLCYFKYEPESPDVMCDNVYIGSGIWQSETDKVVAWMKRPDSYKPKEESADGKRMRELEEFFEGTEFFENRFNEMK